jgi:hypothetical protein
VSSCAFFAVFALLASALLAFALLAFVFFALFVSFLGGGLLRAPPVLRGAEVAGAAFFFAVLFTSSVDVMQHCEGGLYVPLLSTYVTC